MRYILNTLIVPVDFDSYPEVTIALRRVTVEEAREFVRETAITSAIGHEGTAKILSSLLYYDIPVNRTTIFMKPGDKALHFFLKVRLPEGKILSEEELKRLEFWLVVSEVKE